jgi:hypothetical protein
MTHAEWIAAVALACGVILAGAVHVVPERVRLFAVVATMAAGVVSLLMLLVPA